MATATNDIAVNIVPLSLEEEKRTNAIEAGKVVEVAVLAKISTRPPRKGLDALQLAEIVCDAGPGNGFLPCLTSRSAAESLPASPDDRDPSNTESPRRSMAVAHAQVEEIPSVSGRLKLQLLCI